MFSLRNFVKTGFLKAVGKMSDYQIILNAAGWNEKGVLTEDDLARYRQLLTHSIRQRLTKKYRPKPKARCRAVTETLISAGASVLVGALALIGVIITNNRANNKMQNKMTTAQAVTDERISELTREVRVHNNFARRVPVIEEQIKVANHRLADLEELHKPNN